MIFLNKKLLFNLSKSIYLLLFILTAANYWQIFLFRDIYWDDNCWLLSRYSTESVSQFLDHGFNQMRRSLLGIFEYYYMGIHIHTRNPYFFWNLITFTTQFFTVLFIFKLSKILFNKNTFAAFLVVIFYLSNVLDHTLPYVCSINYRLGVLFELVSIYLTSRYIFNPSNKLSWMIYFFAFILTAISAYVFTEATVIFESARFFILISLYKRQNFNLKDIVIKLSWYCFIFTILFLPLIIYKFTYKPYGMYSGIYTTDFSLILNLRDWFDFFKKVFFGFYKVLKRQSFQPDLTLLILTSLFTLFSLVKFYPIFNTLKINTILKSFSFKSAFFLAFFVLVIQAAFFFFANRSFRWGPDSNHGVFMQVIMAYILALLALHFLAFVQKKLMLNAKYFFNVFLSLLVIFGVFVNNFNLKLYRDASLKQSVFWGKFIKKFPSLPEKAEFVFDIDVESEQSSWFDSADLDTSYDIEAYLNILYATNPNHRDFHRYSVIAPEQYRNENMNDIFDSPIPFSTDSRFGIIKFDPKSTIIVRYRNGTIDVDEEILDHNQNVPYKSWILEKKKSKFKDRFNGYESNFVFRRKVL